MSIRHSKIAVAAAIASLTTFGFANVAMAEPTPSSPAQPSNQITLVVPAAAGAPAATTSCTVTAENPHYSKGAGGVIFKARSTCTGGGAALKLTGSIEAGVLIGPGRIVYKGTQYTNQPTTATYTTYFPPTGGPKVACSKTTYYSGYVTVTGTNGEDVQSGSVGTKHVLAGCP